jgi:regulator of cell morphogenesis and NO signaling
MELPNADSPFDWLARGPLTTLMREHEHAGRALAQMRELLHDYRIPPNACTTHRVLLASLESFEADLHLHVHKENNILFPRALRHLGVPS